MGDALSQHPINKPDYYPTEINLDNDFLVESGFSGAFRFAWVKVLAQITIENLNANVKLALNTPRNQDYKGFLQTDDELINQIWDTGRNIIFILIYSKFLHKTKRKGFF